MKKKIQEVRRKALGREKALVNLRKQREKKEMENQRQRRNEEEVDERRELEKIEGTVDEIREILTQIRRRVRYDDVETATDLIYILNNFKRIQFRMNKESLIKETK